MAFKHTDYHYSVTLHTDDRAVVNCRRALSQISQQQGNVRIPWGGTKDVAWEKDGHQVTFRFTSASYRQGFLDLALKVLRPGLFQEVSQNDSDPVSSQSE